jgi:hypothetical protein
VVASLVSSSDHVTGVCLFELISLSLPFNGDTTVALVRSILQEPPHLADIPSIYSTELVNAIEGSSSLSGPSDLLLISLPGLLVKTPNDRWTINAFLMSPAIAVKVSAGVGHCLSLSPQLPQFPASYRPKYLEERLRRFHVRQFSSQIERLGVNLSFPTPLASRQVSQMIVNSENDLQGLSNEEEKVPSLSSSPLNHSLILLTNETKEMNHDTPSLPLSSSSHVTTLPNLNLSPKKLSSSSSPAPTVLTLTVNTSTPDTSLPHPLNETNPSSSYDHFTDPPSPAAAARSILKGFKELSISNIALSDYPVTQSETEVESATESRSAVVPQALGGGGADVDNLATSRINVLEQADNYLRKHQQGQQQPQQQPSIASSPQGNKSPHHLSQLLDSPTDQIQLQPLSSSEGPSPSPRPPLHRNLSGNGSGVSPAFIPGAPTSFRNPSAVSPLTRGRTNHHSISNSDPASPPTETTATPFEQHASVSSAMTLSTIIQLSPIPQQQPSSIGSPQKPSFNLLPSLNLT